MHDWTLVSITYWWSDKRVVIRLRHWKDIYDDIVCEGVKRLSVPNEEEWGESESVNKVHLSEEPENGEKTLRIEMQSGDTIEIVAQSIILPRAD